MSKNWEIAKHFGKRECFEITLANDIHLDICYFKEILGGLGVSTGVPASEWALWSTLEKHYPYSCLPWFGIFEHTMSHPIFSKQSSISWDFQSKTKRKVKHHPAGVISLIHPFAKLQPLLWLSPNAVWSFLQVAHRSHHWGNEPQSCQNVGRYQTGASKNGRPNSWKEWEKTKMRHVMSWFLETLRRGSLNLGILAKWYFPQ